MNFFFLIDSFMLSGVLKVQIQVILRSTRPTQEEELILDV